MSDDRITSLLTSALVRHTRWSEEDDHAARQFSVDTDIDVSPYKVTSFWSNRPDTSIVYEFQDLVDIFNADRLEPRSSMISAGTFRVHVDDGAPEACNVFSQDYTTRTDGVFEFARITDGPKDQGGKYLISLGNVMCVYRDGVEHEVSLFDVLAFLAADDARRDGRVDDAELMVGLIPVMLGSTYKAITQQQAQLVIQRIFTAGIEPLALPRQDTNPVRQHVDPIGKFATRITDIRLFSEGGVDLVVSGENEKREVTTWVSLTSDALDDVDMHGHTIENIDREIMAAFASLWNAGNRAVSLNQIASATGFRRPSKAKAAMIEAHVDKLNRIWASVDATKELRGRPIYDADIVDSAKFSGHLLEVTKSEILTANGRRAVGYKLLQPPIVMMHAMLRGQIVTTPSRLMKVGEGSDTDLNVVLRNRLTTRIQRMKNDKKKSRRIRYVHSAEHPERAGLFEVAGIDVTDRDKKARAVDFCTSCLQGWVDMGWISGFAEVRDKGRGRPVGGVDITL